MTLRLPAAYRGEAAIEIKRSRFLAVVVRTDDEAAARAAIAAERRAHPEARHHCSAFVLASAGAQSVERSSDDGEPSGTAGAPMLDALRGAGLVDVTAVVTRWFGGIKLGTGGLARAYGEAVALALADAPRVRLETYAAVTLDADHAVAGRWQADLLAVGAEVTPSYEGSLVRLHLVHPDAAALASYVAALTQGTGVLEPAGQRTVEVPVDPAPSAH